MQDHRSLVLMVEDNDRFKTRFKGSFWREQPYARNLCAYHIQLVENLIRSEKCSDHMGLIVIVDQKMEALFLANTHYITNSPATFIIYFLVHDNISLKNQYSHNKVLIFIYIFNIDG